jgi:hypothetical protein
MKEMGEWAHLSLETPEITQMKHRIFILMAHVKAGQERTFTENVMERIRILLQYF